jgi:hypothetical protein
LLHFPSAAVFIHLLVDKHKVFWGITFIWLTQNGVPNKRLAIYLYVCVDNINITFCLAG